MAYNYLKKFLETTTVRILSKNPLNSIREHESISENSEHIIDKFK